MAKPRKYYPGVYRISDGREQFGQIIKVGREWHAEIRDTDSGDLIHYAGIWGTLSEAADECNFHIKRALLAESAIQAA